MKEIPSVLKRFWVQILYFTAIPAFYLFFVLYYDPFGIQKFYDMGKGWMAFNVTMIFCIDLLVMVGFRLMFYFLRNVMHLNWLLYMCWCLGELLVISFFVAIYTYLMSGMPSNFFAMWGTCLVHSLSILVYPYTIITLLVLVMDPLGIAGRLNSAEDSLIRFQDENKRLRLVIAASAVLFIEAEENYVRINYLEGDRQKVYVLRTSMKGIEELVSRHGLLRCQRSYYINPSHIKVLKKEKDGSVLAQLDVPESKSIPVSKRYYDNLSAIL